MLNGMLSQQRDSKYQQDNGIERRPQRHDMHFMLRLPYIEDGLHSADMRLLVLARVPCSSGLPRTGDKLQQQGDVLLVHVLND